MSGLSSRAKLTAKEVAVTIDWPRRTTEGQMED